LQPLEVVSNGMNDIRIYPNPFTEVIKLELIDVTDVSVYDVSGRLVFNKQIGPENNALDLKDLILGTYIVKLVSLNQMVLKKIIKLN
jgi:hypothetical protein